MTKHGPRAHLGYQNRSRFLTNRSLQIDLWRTCVNPVTSVQVPVIYLNFLILETPFIEHPADTPRGQLGEVACMCSAKMPWTLDSTSRQSPLRAAGFQACGCKARPGKEKSTAFGGHASVPCPYASAAVVEGSEPHVFKAGLPVNNCTRLPDNSASTKQLPVHPSSIRSPTLLRWKSHEAWRRQCYACLQLRQHELGFRALHHMDDHHAPGLTSIFESCAIDLLMEPDLLLCYATFTLMQGCRLYCTYYTILYYTILYYTILYYTILYYTILYYTILYYTILYYAMLYTILYYILYYTILYYTILYYTILYYTILYYTILYYTILYYTRYDTIGYDTIRYDTMLYFTVLYYTILCSTIYTILYYTILYYTILYYTILYYTILYYAMLYTILYYTILYYTILYYTILYYTILYYTILYYTILCYAMLYYIFYYTLQCHTRRSRADQETETGRLHRLPLGPSKWVARRVPSRAICTDLSQVL